MTSVAQHLSVFSKISIVPFTTVRKILGNKLQKGERVLMTDVMTRLLLFGQDIWLQNRLSANKQKADISEECLKNGREPQCGTLVPSRGQAPFSLYRDLVWRHVPHLFEAALIWDPIHWGSLKEHSICKRPGGFWSYSGLIPSVNLNTNHLCPIHRAEISETLETYGLVCKWFSWG